MRNYAVSAQNLHQFNQLIRVSDIKCRTWYSGSPVGKGCKVTYCRISIRKEGRQRRHPDRRRLKKGEGWRIWRHSTSFFFSTAPLYHFDCFSHTSNSHSPLVQAHPIEKQAKFSLELGLYNRSSW